MKNEAKVFVLIKMGEQQYMENLFYKGDVYMNSTLYYKDNENSEIGDRYEGATIIKNGDILKYRVHLEKEKFYCMWHLNNIVTCNTASYEYVPNSDDIKLTLDFRQYHDFGEYMVVVSNIKEFNRRINNALAKIGLTEENQIVTYYNENDVEEKRISPFMKRSRYGHQNEIRYRVQTDSSEPLLISIGSIEDIAELFPVNCQVEIYARLEE